MYPSNMRPPRIQLLGTGKMISCEGNCLSYRLQIENFNKNAAKYGNYYFISTFTGNPSYIQWYLGMHSGANDHISLNIYYKGMTELDATVKLSIVNIDNEVSKDFIVEGEIKSRTSSSLNYPQFAKKSYINKPENHVLVDDCLTISCDIVLTGPSAVLQDIFKDETAMDFNDYAKLLEDDEFSDITFIVGDKEIRAHKVILAMRSPVFKAMFQHEMQEKKTNIVKIVDVEYAVLKALFRFMYAGVINDAIKMPLDLLVVAEKYCVERLKSLCEKVLSGDLKINNVIQRLATAEAYNASYLKKRPFDFILNHIDEIVDRDEFTVLSPTLMREIVRALASQISK